MYYRGAAAAVVVFDVTSRESFARAQAWVRELQRQASPGLVIALAGNKADLASAAPAGSSEAGGGDAADKSTAEAGIDTLAAGVADAPEAVQAQRTACNGPTAVGGGDAAAAAVASAASVPSSAALVPSRSAHQEGPAVAPVRGVYQMPLPQSVRGGPRLLLEAVVSVDRSDQ